MRKTRLTSKKKRLIIIVIVLAVVLLVAGVFAYRATNKKQVPPSPPQPVFSQLTGVEVDPEDAKRPILGIMIENSEAARPQLGLDSAGIVIEATTEGGITRYLALYQEDMPEVVGPVRSVRPHFLDWAMGFDVSLAHVGGSREALELIGQREVETLDQFEYDKSYYRDDSRQAPHNMYVRTRDLRDLQEELDKVGSQFKEIPRSDDNPSQDPQASSITVDFSSASFLARFLYDQSANRYTRYLAGELDIDTSSDKPITVKNLIVVKTDGQKAIGSGEALVFKDGGVIKARWEKPDYENRVKIIDSENNEVALNRGTTWFAVLPKGRTVDY